MLSPSPSFYSLSRLSPSAFSLACSLSSLSLHSLSVSLSFSFPSLLASCFPPLPLLSPSLLTLLLFSHPLSSPICALVAFHKPTMRVLQTTLLVRTPFLKRRRACYEPLAAKSGSQSRRSSRADWRTNLWTRCSSS